MDVNEDDDDEADSFPANDAIALPLEKCIVPSDSKDLHCYIYVSFTVLWLIAINLTIGDHPCTLQTVCIVRMALYQP